MVKMEQRLKINEEIVREHLATFNDLKLEGDQRATFQTTKELRQINLPRAAWDWRRAEVLR